MDGQRAIRSSGGPHDAVLSPSLGMKHQGSGGTSTSRGLGDSVAIRGAVGTLADYFEQQGPRESDIVWAGTGGDRPGTGFVRRGQHSRL